VKHIWQRSQEHASGSFDITENIANFTPPAYLGAKLTLPLSDRANKHVSVCRSSDLGNQEKDFSEPAGISSSRRYTAPGQALPLYMNQAPLHQDIGPELPEDSYHIRIAIYRKANWVKPSRYQLLKEFMQLRLGILGDTVLSRHKQAGAGIHQGNKAAGTVQERPIQNEVAALSQVQSGWRRHLFQVVIDHTIKLPRAMVALVRQLSCRITLNNPAPKPFLLFGLLGRWIAPASPAARVPTGWAVPALFSLSTMTVSPENT
jgi:hypothetical protein